MFEGPRKPELTEAQKTLAKKRQELARVIERLRSAPLSHGIARKPGNGIGSMASSSMKDALYLRAQAGGAQNSAFP